MAHMVMLQTDCGTVYRECMTEKCDCAGVGREHSTRCDVLDGFADIPGHGILFFSSGEGKCGTGERPGSEIDTLPSSVKSVVVLEIWIAEKMVRCKPERRLRIENACGSLPMQDMEALIRSPLVHKLNKSFGRKHCVFSMYGNITFDSQISKPQFRGVKDFTQLFRFLGQIKTDFRFVNVHLVVMSASIGRCVSVSDYGVLRHSLEKLTGFETDGGMDDDTNCLRFLVTDDKEGFKTSIAISRRGCILMRMLWPPEACYSRDLENKAFAHASDIVSKVKNLC